MKYISTRNNKEIRNLFDIINQNMSIDKGLYIPKKIPNILGIIKDMKTTNFISIVKFVLFIFMNNKECKEYNINKICKKIFKKDNFPLDKNILSIKKMKKNLFLLKISNGKSFSFKDIAISLISEFFKNSKNNIICATSGDTGSSCVSFFYKNKKKTVVLSPYNKISNFQFSQISKNKKNIVSISISGNFDKCQEIVKRTLTNRKLNFNTVNSINILRIIIQISYYLYAVLKLKKKINFYIPTGNFGNAFSCYLLKRMGLPIEITIITNENDMLYNFFSKGIYEKNRKTLQTDSPSMDISNSSNLERYIYYAFKKKDSKKIIKTKKNIKILKFKKNIKCGKTNRKGRKKIIRYLLKKKKYIIDTHTSNALAHYFKKKRKNENVCVLETAKSLKFLEDINIFLKKDLTNYISKKYNINMKRFKKNKKKFYFFYSKDLKKIERFIKILN
ncbi:threonine synthase [Candidatus Vidania fulgoroideorum]